MAEIPDWLTKLAGTTSYLPLETRQTMLPGIVNKLHKTGVLSELTGEDLSQAAVYMSHFLGGSGEPLELEISDKDWSQLVKGANDTGGKTTWTPSTNPEYHADQGWEWKQINPDWGEQPSKKPLYNILGKTTTLRRRKIDNGKYEYQIAEDFDLTRGVGGEDFKRKARKVPPSIAKLIETVFPEYTKDYSEGRKKAGFPDIGRIATTEKLATKGVPVPIKTSYIHSTNRNMEDNLVDFFKKTGKGIF